MTSTTKTRRRIRPEWVMAGVLLAALLNPREALAQRTTATVQVAVTEGGRAPPDGVTVMAYNTDTGSATRATGRSDGSHILTGLVAGEYLIAATPPSGKEASRLVQVQVGQTVNLDIDLAERAPVIQGETVTVEGRLTEAANSEIATNVSRAQMENLPQINRNFLSFAQLAPGVRINDDEFRKEVRAGALGSSQTNVFVDGVSLKSNIIQGGVIGQDASRGNPFPQLAVDGFRIISQNFKAEYEQAGSALITATTRSGGNEFRGDFFTTFQNKDLVARDIFSLRRGEERPELARYQLGAAAGGPVVKDRLHFFLAYEGNYQDRANQVLIEDRTLVSDPELLQRLQGYEGTFISPFREHLGFGKLTWRPGNNQNLEVSASLRRESDIRSFGQRQSYENAENVRINTTTALAKHQWWLGSVLNEASFQFLEGQWNPTVLNPNLIGLDYDRVLKIGGRDSSQDIIQRTFTLRDDVSFSDLEWLGHHLVKTGARVAFQDYYVDKSQFGNPVFRFKEEQRTNLTFAFPHEAEYGAGNPIVSSKNTQFGVYVQDDWQPVKRLTLNLGVRWDVETNPLNNDYVTPDDVRAAVLAIAPQIAAENGPDFFRVENYLTDGTQRPPFLGAIQPRVGFTYDVLGNQSTIAFGGAGRYYDRTLFNDGLDERFRLQYGVRKFRFSSDGAPRDGNPTIAWRDEYLSKQGLDTLIDLGIAPRPEIFLLENDTKPPSSDMYSVGLKQHLGAINATVTLTRIDSRNGLGFSPANRKATGTRDFLPAPENFGNILMSSDDREARFTSLQIVAEKPFSDRFSTGFLKWGASLAYTFGVARETCCTPQNEAFTLFNFAYPSFKDAPMVPTNNDERHRLIVSAITAWPYDFTLSGLVTLGSGFPYTVTDETAGTREDQRVIQWAGGRAEGLIQFSQVDVRLAKTFTVARRHRMGAFVDVFNLFNTRNFGDYNGDIFFDRENPDFAEPRKLIAPTRSLQAGVNYSF
jgi:hypothetical protein